MTTSHFIFDAREIRDMLLSILALGFGFTYMLFSPEAISEWVTAFLAMTGIVTVSFLPHELSHRSTGKAIHCYVRYKLWTTGLFLTIVSSFLGLVFALPGGMQISSKPEERYGRWWIDLTPQQIGIVTMAGPLINLGLALTFLLLQPISPMLAIGGGTHNLFFLAALINAQIAVFNLIPFPPLDGAKLLRWGFAAWISLFVPALLFFVFLLFEGVL